MKYTALAFFIILSLAQWAVPISMISDKQTTVNKGSTWLFRTQPVDPTNPFVGKYIRLDFDISTYYDSSKIKLVYDQPVYVLLEKDSAGFAKVQRLQDREPSGTNDYVKAKILSMYADPDSSFRQVRIDFPFNEFYMEESKAPKAEEVYRNAALNVTIDTYAKIKIWKGDGVTMEVMVGDKPIESYIRK